MMGFLREKQIIIPGIIYTLFLSLLFINASSALAQNLIASGCSVSRLGYLSDLADEYEKRTGVKVFVRGGGSAVGLHDLQADRVDFAAACRDRNISDPEDIEFIQIAWDALVFIVHPSNPINNISLDTATAIYDAKITDWSQMGGSRSPIKLFISKPGAGLSGIEDSIDRLIIKGKKPVVTPNTIFIASAGIAEQMIESTPEGFTTTGFSSARKRKVKMLKFNGTAPTKENISSGRYPFKRPLFLLVPKGSKTSVKDFIDFALSRDGQRIISSLGVVPIRNIE